MSLRIHVSSATSKIAVGAALALVLVGCRTFPVGFEEPRVTVAGPAPNLGAPPVGIPADPLEVVNMEVDGELTPAQVEFVEAQPGYQPGSLELEAFHRGANGRKTLVTWRAVDAGGRTMGCSALLDENGSAESTGCSSPIPDREQQTIHGYGYTSETFGDNLIEVHHGGQPEATVVELADGSTFVIRPGTSSISYHEWRGRPPARITVFWPDGTTESVLTHP